MSKEFYRAGVLMIGSLLWDNTKGRKPWREHYFGENFFPNIIDVKVPIRYGRFSQNRGCPTMVLSSEYWKEKKYGTAKFISFKNQELQFSELICAARDLSEAEDSNDRNFIKGNTEWCIIVYWINNNISEKIKSEFSEKWKKIYKDEGKDLSNGFLNEFKMESEREKANFINDKGCLKFDWPESLKEFDLILVTHTKPRRKPKDQSEYLKPNKLASQIFKKPKYFIKNTLNGIITSEDNSIIDLLKDNELSIFRANALQDGCSERETDVFIQSFLK